jgi:hypothetical protein
MMKRSTLVLAVCVLFFIVAGGFAANTVQAGDGTAAGTLREKSGNDEFRGYTYISLEKNGKKTWVAIPETAVKVGQTITCQPGMEMKNFTSKTLKRSFESIVFSAGLR